MLTVEGKLIAPKHKPFLVYVSPTYVDTNVNIYLPLDTNMFKFL